MSIHNSFADNVKILMLKGAKGDGVDELRTEMSALEGEISVERSRIDSLAHLTDGSTTGDAELQDIRIGLDGSTYVNAGDAVRGQIGYLQDNFIRNNSFDVLSQFVNIGWSSTTGITCVHNADGTFTLTGTASSTFLIRPFYSPSAFPDGMKNGGTYYVKHEAKVAKVRVYAYFNNDLNNFTTIYESTHSGFFTVPTNATGINLQICVVQSGNTVNETIDAPRILTEYTNSDIAKSLQRFNSYEFWGAPDVPSTVFNGITYSCDDGVVSLQGTTGSDTWYYRYFYSANSLPNWVEHGKKYAVNFDPKGESVDGLRLQIATYKADSSYILLCDTTENTEFKMPEDTAYIGMMIRLFIKDSGTVINATVEPRILNAKTNEMLTSDVIELKQSSGSGAVTLIKSGQYYVRSEYDETQDAVVAFRYPETGYNYTFNLRDVRLIDKNTPIGGTIDAYTVADVYKDMHDDIPAFTINGVIVGSNHGNPNFIKCVCNHSLTSADIGTTWGDGTYTYTIVQVFSGYIIVGSLDANGQLIYREPSTLTRSGTTLTITGHEQIQLRRSAINRKIRMLNDAGADVSLGGGGQCVKIVEEYDICDQSKMLAYLSAHAGSCTNASYHDDAIPYVLCTIRNLFIFNENSTMTVFGNLTAREPITVNRLWGAMSLDFHNEDAGNDYGYVPQSSQFTSPTAINYSQDMQITPSSNGVPYRFYQMTNTGNGKGFFLHLLDGLGDCYAETRRTLSPFAYFSANAVKLYLQVRQNVSMVNGDILSWGYGRGLYKKTAGQTVNACFKVNDSWIVALDWHSAHSGYVDLPDALSGGRVTVLDKTDNVTVLNDYVGNNGIKVNSTGNYGYCVLRID